MSELDGLKECLERLAKQRATWPRPGPWDDEPNRETFESAGYPCIVQRGGSGAWCGYVGVPPGQGCHGKGCSDMETSRLSVHGGITYAEKCSGGVCHVPKPGEPADVWWLGFDCNHYGDAAPGKDEEYWRGGGHYRTIEYVKRETRRLAEQLRAWPRLERDE